MSPRVLIVEDNQDLAENVCELLEDEGVDVQVCADVEAALTAAEHGFDIALVDIRLGRGESGLDLAPRLRARSTLGEVILMTGNATLDTAIDAIQQGVYAYLQKPFEPEQLITLSRRALAQVALKRDKRELARRLAASEALHRGVVDTVEACIFGLDADNRIRLSNPFAAVCTGRSHEELVGLPFVEVCGCEDGAALLAAVENGEVVRDRDHDLVRPNGDKRRVRWTFTALGVSREANGGDVPQEGSARGATSPVILAVGIDVTERMELEKRQAETEALAAMGTLTTGLAHEIRNPLNAAKLQLELLMRRARKLGDEAAKKSVTGPAGLVRDELQRLSNLLDDFLGLARPRGVARYPLSVDDLFRAVRELQAPVGQAARIELSHRVDPQALQVEGDHEKLKQVLINLVGNAIDAMRDRAYGNIQLTAREAADGWVELDVADDGPGVAPEVMEAAFQPFVTSKEAGTGLGLTIVQRIVEQHGGTAQLLPRPEGGTIARIRIPQ